MPKRSSFNLVNAYMDPKIHDTQHWLGSLAGAVVGLGIFLTYYFFSRIETQTIYKSEEHDDQLGTITTPLPWDMPWWYFVVGIILCMSTASAIACMLSVGLRRR